LIVARDVPLEASADKYSIPLAPGRRIFC